MTSKAKKVLIVEDDKFISRIMKSTLEEEGYLVEHVEDGAEAIKAIESDDYCIILLDLIMPIMDGFEFLRKLNEGKNKTPILVFSNLSQSEDKKLALSLGAKSYYVKSNITISELLKAVKKYAY